MEHFLFKFCFGERREKKLFLVMKWASFLMGLHDWAKEDERLKRGVSEKKCAAWQGIKKNCSCFVCSRLKECVCERERKIVYVRERMCEYEQSENVCVRERVCVRENVCLSTKWKCVCVLKKERKRFRVCVCVRERERERKKEIVCERMCVWEQSENVFVF